MDTPPPGQGQAMAAESQHLPVESAVIPSPETTPTANIQAAADVPSPPSPKPSTSNADLNHNTDLDDEIVEEIDELMHEPREVVAMETGAFGSHAPAQGLSEAALNELRAKNVNFVTSMKSKSSLRRTENTVQRLTKWLRQKGEMRSLQNIPTTCFDQLLALWLSDIRKPSGEEYEPNTLSSYFSSVKSHMVEIGANVDNLKMMMKVLHAKRKDLKSQGKGNTPNRAGCLTAADEEKLWEAGALGSTDPETLLHTVWFIFSKCFGFRGCQEFRQLKWGDIAKKQDDNGDTYLEWNERLTKTRAGNSSHQRAFPPKIFRNKKFPERCPIALYDLYSERRNPNCDDFLQGVNYNRPSPQSKWFMPQPMGINRIGQIMSRIARRAGLVGKYTNHSIRRSMCTQLFKKGMDSELIRQLSGHKTVQGLAPYTMASVDQQISMCAILQHDKSKKSVDPLNMMAIPGNVSDDEVERAAINAPEPRNCLTTSQSQSSANNFSMQSGARNLMGLMSGTVFNAPVSIHFHVNQQQQ